MCNSLKWLPYNVELLCLVNIVITYILGCWTVYLICVCTGVWSLGEGYRWAWFRSGVIWCGGKVSVRRHCSETCRSLEPSSPESHLEVLPFISSFVWSNRSNHLCVFPLYFSFLSYSIHWQLTCGIRSLISLWLQLTILFSISKPVKPHSKLSGGFVRLSNGF